MAREERSPNVFFRYEGRERKDIFFRINPTAVRYQQATKGSVKDTLGGYFKEVFRSADAQYNALTIASLTIEGTTGVRYRRELEEIDWARRHQGELKADKTPADIYFYDLIEDAPFQGVERSKERVYLIFIEDFSYDDSVDAFGEIRFAFRCRVLRNVLGALDETPPNPRSLPTLPTTPATPAPSAPAAPAPPTVRPQAAPPPPPTP